MPGQKSPTKKRRTRAATSAPVGGPLDSSTIAPNDAPAEPRVEHDDAVADPSGDGEEYVDGEASEEDDALVLDRDLVSIFEKSLVLDTENLVKDARKHHDVVLKKKHRDEADLFLETFKHCITVSVKSLDASTAQLEAFILQYLESVVADSRSRNHGPSTLRARRSDFIKSIYLMAVGGLSASLGAVRRFSCVLVSQLNPHQNVLGIDNQNKGTRKMESRIFDSDGKVRIEVLKFFATQEPDERLVEPTLLLADKDPLPKVRLQATETLQMLLPAEQFVNVMADRVRDVSVAVREAAYHHLSEVDFGTFLKSLDNEALGERFHHKVNTVLKGIRDQFSVAKAAAWQLVGAWLKECRDGDGLVDLTKFVEQLKVVATPEDSSYFFTASLEKEALMMDIYERAEQLKVGTDMTRYIHTGTTPEQAFLVRSYSSFLERNNMSREGLMPRAPELMAEVDRRYRLLISGELDNDVEAYIRQDYILGQMLHTLADDIDLGSQSDEINELVTQMLHRPMVLDRHVKTLFRIRRKCTEQTEDFMARNMDLFDEVRESEPDNNRPLVVLASGIASNVSEIHDQTQLEALIACAKKGFEDEPEWLMESLRAFSLLMLTSLQGVRERLAFLVGYHSALVDEIHNAEKELQEQIEETRAKLEACTDEEEREELEEELETLEMDNGESENQTLLHTVMFALADVMMRFKFQHTEGFDIIKKGLSMDGTTTQVISTHLVCQLIFSECINKEDEEDLLSLVIGLYVSNFHNTHAPVTVAGKTTIQGIKDSVFFFLTAYCYKQDCKDLCARACIGPTFAEFEAFAREVSLWQDRLKPKNRDLDGFEEPDYDVEDRLAGYRSILESFVKLVSKRDPGPAVVPSRSFYSVILLDILKLLPRLAPLIKAESVNREEMGKNKSGAVRVYYEFQGSLAGIIKQVARVLRTPGQEEVSVDMATSLISHIEDAVEHKYLTKTQLAPLKSLAEQLQQFLEEQLRPNQTQLSDEEDVEDGPVMLGGQSVPSLGIQSLGGQSLGTTEGTSSLNIGSPDEDYKRSLPQFEPILGGLDDSGSDVEPDTKRLHL